MSLKCISFFLIIVLLCQTSSSRNITKWFNPEELQSTIASMLGDTKEDLIVAARMFDASSKFPSGILAGNFFDLGNFDECYDIKSGEIYGKYCLGMPRYPIPMPQTAMQKRIQPLNPQPLLIQTGAEYAGFHVGVCVPNSVAAKDINHGLLSKFTEDFCYSKDTAPKLSGGGIATIVIVGAFFAIAVVSTCFDVYLHYSKKEVPHELFIAFSFLTNGRKLITASTNPDQLLCLNGIKSISMMWVILGHGYSIATNSAILNFNYLQTWQENVINMIILGAPVSVDTFFLVGGTVTVYTFLKTMDRGQKFNIFLFYIHRYLRLTPILAIIVLLNTNLLDLMGNGPLWRLTEMGMIQPCKDQWYGAVLYIGNYLDLAKGFCIPQTWYLSVDMQLFVFSPLVLIPLSKWPKYGLGALAALIVAGAVVPFVISYENNIGSMTTDRNYMKLYYIQTYARFGPYVIGMLLGYIIYKIKNSTLKIQLQPVVVAALWAFALAGLVSCVFAGHDLTIYRGDRLANAFFIAFNRNGWAVSLAILIFLCVSGYGGPVDLFLSIPLFQFLTKLSYSMYLVHFGLIQIKYNSLKNSYKYSNSVQMQNFWGDFMWTLAISTILCLNFESPVIILEKYLFGRGVRKPTQNKV